MTGVKIKNNTSTFTKIIDVSPEVSQVHSPWRDHPKATPDSSRSIAHSLSTGMTLSQTLKKQSTTQVHMTLALMLF